MKNEDLCGICYGHHRTEDCQDHLKSPPQIPRDEEVNRPPAAPSGVYFCVVDPANIFVHTTLSISSEEAIEQWLEQERATRLIINAARVMRKEKPICSPSWEQCEAEGYRCLPVKLEVSNANNS